MTSPVNATVCFFSSRRRHTRFDCDWSSDVCSSDLHAPVVVHLAAPHRVAEMHAPVVFPHHVAERRRGAPLGHHGVGFAEQRLDRKSTRLNSSHSQISYAVFCLKKKINTTSLRPDFL